MTNAAKPAAALRKTPMEPCNGGDHNFGDRVGAFPLGKNKTKGPKILILGYLLVRGD